MNTSVDFFKKESTTHADWYNDRNDHPMVKKNRGTISNLLEYKYNQNHKDQVKKLHNKFIKFSLGCIR